MGKNKFNPEYFPDQTDCTADLPFTKQDVDTLEIALGPEYILMQSLPCSVTKLVVYISSSLGTTDYTSINGNTENQNFTVLDARKHNPGTFSEAGFTLIKLDEESKTKNWRPESEDIHLFQDQMTPYLKKLYPQTKRIEWLSNLVRGGVKFGDQPRAMGPHLDYYQDDKRREDFHQRFPPLEISNRTEPHALLGLLDSEEEKLGVLLGLWKPLYPSQICDYPLAVMDAGTFKPENQIPYELHINFLIFV